jgi:hypothetical protein
MSIFAKKLDTRGVTEPPPAPPPDITASRQGAAQPPKPRTYSIGDAIQLMRTLPFDNNVDLVVQVIRATLGSMNVRVQDIIEDAVRKEKSIHEGIASLHGKVADLERELDARCKEITALEADLAETTSVKERLQMSETHGRSSSVPILDATPEPSTARANPPPPPASDRMPIHISGGESAASKI